MNNLQTFVDFFLLFFAIILIFSSLKDLLLDWAENKKDKEIFVANLFLLLVGCLMLTWRIS